MKVQCCVCEKVRVEGEWVSSSEESSTKKVRVSHGYCPPCANRELRHFHRQRKSANRLIPAAVQY